MNLVDSTENAPARIAQALSLFLDPPPKGYTLADARKVVSAAGYTVQKAEGLFSSYYALLPGETVFFDNADEVEEAERNGQDLAHRQNYVGFFSSEEELLEEILEDISLRWSRVDTGVYTPLRSGGELHIARAPGEQAGFDILYAPSGLSVLEFVHGTSGPASALAFAVRWVRQHEAALPALN